MSRIRRWYTYNLTPGGQYNQLNYWITPFPYQLPNACLTSANNICAVKGIFSETVNGITYTYGNNPKNFASDNKLWSYLNGALGTGHSYPFAGNKPYVYVRM
jgi:hypothetical protein